MNKRILVPIATGLVFATVLAAGCAANKRTKPASIAPAVLNESSATAATTTRPSIVESTVQKIITVYKEAPTEATTTTTEATTTTAKPTATPKPTAKPTAKPTKKPTAKPTKKPTKKPTAKPTVKKTTAETAKTNTLKTVSNNISDSAKQITGIYHGPWSDVTIDGTNLQRVKITATIHDSEDSSKASVWKMEGKYNPATGAILYTNCTKVNYEYDSNNNVAAKNTAYSNGQGKIVIGNGMVTWHDYQEHIAEDMTFISAKTHDHGSN
ncbi:MAG: hypothetical protein IJ819_09425 [Clostridiales bacterium]|nr:hypothetical protein [Clostridiales bacterium]